MHDVERVDVIALRQTLQNLADLCHVAVEIRVSVTRHEDQPLHEYDLRQVGIRAALHLRISCKLGKCRARRFGAADAHDLDRGRVDPVAAERVRRCSGPSEVQFRDVGDRPAVALVRPGSVAVAGTQPGLDMRDQNPRGRGGISSCERRLRSALDKDSPDGVARATTSLIDHDIGDRRQSGPRRE